MRPHCPRESVRPGEVWNFGKRRTNADRDLAIGPEFNIGPVVVFDFDRRAVVADGLAHRKSDSALAALARLPGWGWAGALRALPKPARDFLYDRIARNSGFIVYRMDLA